MHGEQAGLARRAGLEGDVGAPAHGVLRQAERLEVPVAAVLQAAPDRKTDVLHVAALREAELVIRKQCPCHIDAVDFLERDDVRGQRGGEVTQAREVHVAPATLKREVAGNRPLVAARTSVLPVALRGEGVEYLRPHHPFHIPGREREALGGGRGTGECGREGGRCEPLHVAAWRRFATRSVTTAGSASVEMSPRCSCSSAAILRRIRRMILPERVFGSPGAH